MKKITKPRAILATLGLITIGGFAAASATTLALQANHDLSAGTSVTQSCQSGTIGVAFGTPDWDSATEKFNVSEVTLSSLETSCDGRNAKIVVADDAGGVLGEASAVLSQSGGNQTFTLSSAAASDSVASINVVVY